MTISSSLNAGVAGLNANATRLATIADNIANSGTYGYKRAMADFQAMVNSGTSPSGYAAGGVRSSTMRLIDERGPLIASANPTDIAIDGRGFLPVTDINAINGGATSNYPISLTTTGSFRPDANGVLRTQSGHVLMGWPAAANGTLPAFPRDSMSGLEPVRVDRNQFVANPTTEMTFGINLPATETAAGALGDALNLTVEYFGNLGTSETLDVTFTPTIPTTGSSNEWTMEITDSATGTVVGEYTLTFDATATAGGTLASVTTVTGGAFDPLTGRVALTLPGGAIDLNIGIPGSSAGMTQLSSTYSPTAISKNGSPVGTLVSVEIDDNGYLHAIYDQGFSRRIYQIPVVDVANPNGLVSLSDQAYQLSQASGSFFLWNAGEGPTGSTAGFSREQSATDVAGELTSLIQTQRAYSSNAKIIQTVDEMLQETTNIKR